MKILAAHVSKQVIPCKAYKSPENRLLATLIKAGYSQIEMRSFTVKKPDENGSLLDYLQRRMALAPEAYLRQLLRSGKVRCNGIQVTATHKLKNQDIISLPESKKTLEFLFRSEKLPLVLYESDHVLVVHKPSGLATHSSKEHATDNMALRVETLMHLEQNKFKTAPVHRLDLPTSGPIIFGKGKKAISELGKLMQSKQVQKKYIALTSAGLPESGLLASQISSKGKNKHAETRFRTIEQQGNLTLLELELHTGRQHQIRMQLSEAGHPVAGDTRYRSTMSLKGLDRLFLHCHQLTFTDPFTGQTVNISDPLPPALSQVLIDHNFSYRTR